jgi:hypothetical protein
LKATWSLGSSGVFGGGGGGTGGNYTAGSGGGGGSSMVGTSAISYTIIDGGGSSGGAIVYGCGSDNGAPGIATITATSPAGKTEPFVLDLQTQEVMLAGSLPPSLSMTPKSMTFG